MAPRSQTTRLSPVCPFSLGSRGWLKAALKNQTKQSFSSQRFFPKLSYLVLTQKNCETVVIKNICHSAWEFLDKNFLKTLFRVKEVRSTSWFFFKFMYSTLFCRMLGIRTLVAATAARCATNELHTSPQGQNPWPQDQNLN